MRPPAMKGGRGAVLRRGAQKPGGDPRAALLRKLAMLAAARGPAAPAAPGGMPGMGAAPPAPGGSMGGMGGGSSPMLPNSGM